MYFEPIPSHPCPHFRKPMARSRQARPWLPREPGSPWALVLKRLHGGGPGRRRWSPLRSSPEGSNKIVLLLHESDGGKRGENQPPQDMTTRLWPFSGCIEGNQPAGQGFLRGIPPAQNRERSRERYWMASRRWWEALHSKAVDSVRCSPRMRDRKKRRWGTGDSLRSQVPLTMAKFHSIAGSHHHADQHVRLGNIVGFRGSKTSERICLLWKAVESI